MREQERATPIRAMDVLHVARVLRTRCRSCCGGRRPGIVVIVNRDSDQCSSQHPQGNRRTGTNTASGASCSGAARGTLFGRMNTIELTSNSPIVTHFVSKSPITLAPIRKIASVTFLIRSFDRIFGLFFPFRLVLL